MGSFLLRKRNFILKAANVAVVVALVAWFSTWAAETNQADAQVQQQILEAQKVASRGPFPVDGTFTGSAQGYGGLVTTQVTIEGGYLEKVQVVDAPNEDGPYLEQAVKLIDDMLMKQTPNVDVVSGATFSSAGIINGVIQAIDSAGSGEGAGTGVATAGSASASAASAGEASASATQGGA